MDQDELEKKYIKQFIRECKKHNLRVPKKDDEGIPTLRPRSKKNPWCCQPWGLGQACLSVFDPERAADGDTLHGKTLNAVLKKFLKYVPDFDITVDEIDDPSAQSRLGQNGIILISGDGESNIIFPLSKLLTVAEQFGFVKKKASKGQLEYRAKFGQKMKQLREQNKNT